MRLAPLAVLATCWFAPQAAHAVEFENAGITTIVVLGTLGGVTTSVGAVVHAVEARSFSDPWIVGSLISSAICGATTVAFAVDGFSSGGGPELGIGLLFYAALTVWPTYWTIKTSLSEVDPGDKFEGEYLPEEPVDPFKSSRLPDTGASLFSFGGSF